MFAGKCLVGTQLHRQPAASRPCAVHRSLQAQRKCVVCDANHCCPSTLQNCTMSGSCQFFSQESLLTGNMLLFVSTICGILLAHPCDEKSSWACRLCMEPCTHWLQFFQELEAGHLASMALSWAPPHRDWSGCLLTCQDSGPQQAMPAFRIIVSLHVRGVGCVVKTQIHQPDVSTAQKAAAPPGLGACHYVGAHMQLLCSFQRAESRCTPEAHAERYWSCSRV